MRVPATATAKNRVAVLDPNAVQADPVGSGVNVMQEVLTILGITADPAAPAGGVKEWCINTAAVDPATHSVLINSEDGYLYRWDLSTNQFTQKISDEQRRRAVVHADRGRRRRCRLRGQQRGVVLGRQVTRPHCTSSPDRRSPSLALASRRCALAHCAIDHRIPCHGTASDRLSKTYPTACVRSTTSV